MMQNEISRIIEQVEQLYTSNNWVGFNLDELLNCITDEVANFKLSLFNNTIHQIANHIVSDSVVIKRLQGIDYKLSNNEIWVPKNEIKCKWKDTVKEIRNNKIELIRQLQVLSDDRLNQPILKGHKSIYVNIHGFIQYSYYHFGQIAIMHKAITLYNK